MISIAIRTSGLVSEEEVMDGNSVHGKNHLTVKAIASHGQTNLVTIFHQKLKKDGFQTQKLIS